MKRIDHITINGFKSIKRLEKFPLNRLNLLIGANGSGKSNFLDALGFFAAIQEYGSLPRVVARVGGADRLLHFGSKVTKKMEFEFYFRGPNGRKAGKAVHLEPSVSDSLIQTERWLDHPFPDEANPNEPEYVLRHDEKNSPVGIGSHVEWRRFHFHDTGPYSPLKKTNRLNDNRLLRQDGANLAAFLFLLQDQYPREFSLISKTVQRVVPFFDSFQLAPRVEDPGGILLEWRHKLSNNYFDADSLSDGTLRFMALATLLLQPVELQPHVIIVDEPELGLHPFAITLLASLMKMAAKHTQVIVATQSSLLIDHFAPEDIVVVDQVEGASQFKRFDESDQKRLADWLEDYSLGQLWEKNELGGRPVAY